MLEAHRMPRGSEAVEHRYALDERTRPKRKRHTAFQPSALRKMIDDERSKFALAENAPCLVDRSDPICVTVARKPEPQPARCAHALREFAKSAR